MYPVWSYQPGPPSIRVTVLGRREDTRGNILHTHPLSKWLYWATMWIPGVTSSTRAMQDELNNFTRNEVRELVERPKGKNIIGTKWVFKNKEDEHGAMVRNKVDSLPKASLKWNVWTLVKPLLLLLYLKQFVSFLHMHPHITLNLSNGCEKCIFKWIYK